MWVREEDVGTKDSQVGVELILSSRETPHSLLGLPGLLKRMKQNG